MKTQHLFECNYDLYKAVEITNYISSRTANIIMPMEMSIDTMADIDIE